MSSDRNTKRMKILITGGTGLIGSALSKTLNRLGHDVAVLTRKPSKNPHFKSYFWDPSKGEIDEDAFQNLDCIIHLAGANIADNRWTKKYKQELFSSRVESANFLFRKVKELDVSLKSFISSSAIGWYGAITSDKIFIEQDPCANDFLGQLSKQWELAADQFSDLGCLVSKVRSGIVLSSQGGALPKMTKPIVWGLGASLGSGKQYIPWIHVDDLCAIYIHLLEGDLPVGVYNGVAPESVTNKELTDLLAQALNKTLWLPNIPSWVLRLLYGKMSALLLNGSRVSAEKLSANGFEFKCPTIRRAIASIIY